MTSTNRQVLRFDPATLSAADACALAEKALTGTGPALVPDGPAVSSVHSVTSTVALLLPTSGSTGTPKLVELSAGALLASATATTSYLGGAGDWLLALPLTHIAGWQVVIRAVSTGASLHMLPADRPFTADAFTETVRRRPPRYLSLVPTQLKRLLQQRDSTAALAQCDAVLIGGAAVDSRLTQRAQRAGIRVVRTYGMTETCGGCVYDGVPLPGTHLSVEQATSRVWLSGPMLARGYLGDPERTAATFVTRDGQRWVRTGDAGHIGPDGALHIDGRLDNVIVTGAEKVHPGAVERVLRPHLGHVAVVGLPDEQWGQRVVALVTGRPRQSDIEDGTAAVRAQLGPAAVPKQVLMVDELPVTALGKPDRVATARMAAPHTRNPKKDLGASVACR
ncbi:MAG: AMP-dependent synthetase [Micrococcales bacterium]|nr:MAG: AMP-dependent synthetase [Micrococcales bacterium]PIE25784.1 MAG: AMP-dependent synthetase [Micrococcales bacterium]